MTIATETRTLSSLELFYEEVLRDSSLQEQLKAATSSENLIEIAVKLGAERGYDLDKAQITRYLESSEDIDLNQVNVPMALGCNYKPGCAYR